jgi:hypothetical protein
MIAPESINVNILEVSDESTEKKKPLAFSFGASNMRNIEVNPVKKIDDYETVPEPEIVKEEGEYKIIRKNPAHRNTVET